ncbi:pseudouridine-5'-phosphate glycosidase isoform X2 [Leptinotarsa decemlineata]|uniref:pseudouridine-5'-phosphate glycosidase isoform X2 n=1 Tax=Leptinotarsa decemlineata TaxID=7539 RepID=UPI003D30AD05
MIRLGKTLAILKNHKSFPAKRKVSMYIKEEIRDALKQKKAVVALESTIITHGMPFPENVNCALQVEQIVRQQGAVPATIAIVKGRIKIGLSPEEIVTLGDTKSSDPVKISRRDLSYAISNKRNGGTTVSATIIAATKAGIPIFATGGIGGVHRGAESTFDISADLIELGRSKIAVISSGVKSILDISKTLEYLETQGVFVATFGKTNDFPAFYSTKSGFNVPYCIQRAEEAAAVIKCHNELDLQSGMLFAVPIPEEYAFDPEIIEGFIEKALKEANCDDVRGKNITPYLLSQIAKLTGGKSLESNVALIKNNARVAADIAVALVALEDGAQTGNDASQFNLEGRPFVIGGSNLDCSATLDTSEIKLDGRILNANFTYTAGGVGRNICESLCKLGFPPNFLSVVGADERGKMIMSVIPPQSRHFVRVDDSCNTAECIVVFDDRGSCRLLMGDMKIHNKITPEVILENESIIKTAPLIILDSNLSEEAIEECLKLAVKHNIPVKLQHRRVVCFHCKLWRR